jgi:hypothetical protein
MPEESKSSWEKSSWEMNGDGRRKSLNENCREAQGLPGKVACRETTSGPAGSTIWLARSLKDAPLDTAIRQSSSVDNDLISHANQAPPPSPWSVEERAMRIKV